MSDPRDDHACLITDCSNPAPFGFRPSRSAPYKWACGEHRHLLERQAAPPAPAKPKNAPIGDLFGKAR